MPTVQLAKTSEEYKIITNELSSLGAVNVKSASVFPHSQGLIVKFGFTDVHDLDRAKQVLSVEFDENSLREILVNDPYYIMNKYGITESEIHLLREELFAQAEPQFEF